MVTSRFDPVRPLLALTGPRPHIVLAFSGGLDSTVLAHALVKRRRQLGAMRLVHVDHGLQPASRDWSRRCADQADDWRVPFTLLRIRLSPKRGESVEAAAREARYRLLADDLRTGETLLTAQHRDDQVETLLLQLLRGAGVSGLASMPAAASFGGGRIVRPLLEVARDELYRYAIRHRLSWIEDPTNRGDRFDRSFLRQRLLPSMRARWKGMDEAVARSARHMAEAAHLLDAAAQRDLLTAMDGDGLNAAVLRRLSMPRRRLVLRTFIARAGLELPSSARMTEMAGPLLVARPDAQPEVRWPAGCLRRRSGRVEIHVTSRAATGRQLETPPKSWRWNDERVFLLNDAGERLRLVDDNDGNIDLERLPGTLVWRRRRGGESLRPGPHARTQSLKKLMQAAGLTIEERGRLPLLFSGRRPEARLLAAGDRWIDASIVANVKSRRRARLVWEKSG